MIDRSHRPIPDITLKTLAKSFFKNAFYYGFRKSDYLRFANCLLGVMIDNSTKFDRNNRINTGKDFLLYPTHITQLPINGDEVTLTNLEYQKSFSMVEQLMSGDLTRHSCWSTINLHNTSHINTVESGRSKVATVMTRQNNQPIGVIAFVDCDAVHRKAELLVYIDEIEEEHKTLKKEAIMLWLTFGIKVLGLRKIYTNTLSTDGKAITLNEELGFRIEGILQNEVISENCYCDILRMRLFANEPNY